MKRVLAGCWIFALAIGGMWVSYPIGLVIVGYLVVWWCTLLALYVLLNE